MVAMGLRRFAVFEFMVAFLLLFPKVRDVDKAKRARVLW